MKLILEIPEDIASLASQLFDVGGDLSRRALESFALEEYKSAHLTEDALRRLLGFTTRHQLDGFLKAHDVWVDYSIEDSAVRSIALNDWGSDGCNCPA